MLPLPLSPVVTSFGRMQNRPAVLCASKMMTDWPAGARSGQTFLPSAASTAHGSSMKFSPHSSKGIASPILKTSSRNYRGRWMCSHYNPESRAPLHIQLPASILRCGTSMPSGNACRSGAARRRGSANQGLCQRHQSHQVSSDGKEAQRRGHRGFNSRSDLTDSRITTTCQLRSAVGNSMLAADANQAWSLSSS